MSMLRKLSWSVFAGLALEAAAASAPAQEVIQPKDAQPGQPIVVKDAKLYVVPINITKTIGMTRAAGAADDPILEKAQNENPKIVRVQIIQNDPRHILVTGVSPGTSRITLTGYTDPNMKDRHDEVVEIRVPSDDEPVREQQRRDFLDLVRRTAPTANVDAIVGPNNAVFLTGNVLTADSVQTILETARSVFGPGVQLQNNMRFGSVPQVEIACTICSVNRSKIRNMSFSWSLNRKDWFLQSILGPGTFTNSITTGIAAAAATQATSGGNIVFGAVNNDGAFFGFLQALRQDALAKFQAEPKVTTLSGKPAQITSGGQVPTLTASGQGSPTVEYKDFGTVVTVLPIVLGNGKIHLEIAPIVTKLNAANGIVIPGVNSTTVINGFDKQGAQVAIQLESGQTVAIGGLIQHTNTGAVSKVPVLGDMPFIGAAFRTVSHRDLEEELIILVTPRLIDPMGCDQLPCRLPTRLTRSPDDFELYLEGLIELPRGQRQTCGPDGCYQAPHKLGPTAGLFPCGDQGSCGLNGFGHRGGVFGHHANCSTTCAPGANGVAPCAPAIAPANVPAPAVAPAPAANDTAKFITTTSAPVRPMPMSSVPTPPNFPVSTMPAQALPPAPISAPPTDLPPPVAPAGFGPTETPIYTPPLRLPGAPTPLNTPNP